MENSKLTSLATHALNNENVFGLSRNTVEITAPVKELLGTTALGALDLLETNSKNLGNRIKQEKYKFFTKEINALNRECDLLWGEIKKRLRIAASSLTDNKLAQEAKSAQSYLDSYKNLDALGQGTQFQVTDEMIQKIEGNQEIKTVLTNVNADKAYEMLKVKNALFKEKWTLRNDLLGDQKELPTATSTRRQVTKHYNLFCNALLNQIKVAPTPELTALLADLNTVRAKYSAFIAKKKKGEADNSIK